MGHAGNDTPKDSSISGDEAPDESSREDGASGEVDAWMRALREVAPYLDLGWRLAGSTAFPPLIGYGLDVWLETVPWGLLVGCVVGLSSAYVQLRRLQQDFGQ